MPRRDPVEQLRALNEVLAQTAGSDPECAEHARRALDFFSMEHAEAQAKIHADAQASAKAEAEQDPTLQCVRYFLTVKALPVFKKSRIARSPN